QAGASIVYVKEQMGHSSIQVTVDTYGHLIPGANTSLVDRLDTVRKEKVATTPQRSVNPDAEDRNDIRNRAHRVFVRGLFPAPSRSVASCPDRGRRRKQTPV